MKKIYFVTILLSFYSLIATAEQINYCTYGRSGNGPAYFNFTKVEIPMSSYQAVLSKDLIVTVRKTQWHSAVYKMIANFNLGQITIQDTYGDFQPYRLLNISGTVDGKDLYCVFDPVY